MMRKIFTFYCAVFAVIGLLVYPHSAAAVNVRSHSVIENNVITLNDVFLGLSEAKGTKVLGPAPRPGSEMVLNARTLLRIAVAMDLPWRPQHAGEHVVLTRSASIVDRSMIEDALKNGITAQGHEGNFEIAFHSALSDMVLPVDYSPSVDVQSISMHAASGRFDAVLVAPSQEEPLQTMRVSGVIHRVVALPILKDTVRSGYIIRKRDIDSMMVRESSLKSGMALRAEDLIGMTPRRMIIAGKPVSMNDLKAPQIVERGDFVTITYNHAGMRLTAQGKALENGAMGEPIRVANSASSRTIEAIVTGDRAVIVERF